MFFSKEEMRIIFSGMTFKVRPCGSSPGEELLMNPIRRQVNLDNLAQTFAQPPQIWSELRARPELLPQASLEVDARECFSGTRSSTGQLFESQHLAQLIDKNYPKMVFEAKDFSEEAVLEYLSSAYAGKIAKNSEEFWRYVTHSGSFNNCRLFSGKRRGVGSGWPSIFSEYYQIEALGKAVAKRVEELDFINSSSLRSNFLNSLNQMSKNWFEGVKIPAWLMGIINPRGVFHIPVGDNECWMNFLGKIKTQEAADLIENFWPEVMCRPGFLGDLIHVEKKAKVLHEMDLNPSNGPKRSRGSKSDFCHVNLFEDVLVFNFSRNELGQEIKNRTGSALLGSWAKECIPMAWQTLVSDNNHKDEVMGILMGQSVVFEDCKFAVQPTGVFSIMIPVSSPKQVNADQMAKDINAKIASMLESLEGASEKQVRAWCVSNIVRYTNFWQKVDMAVGLIDGWVRQSKRDKLISDLAYQGDTPIKRAGSKI